jgi:hypothetical protein
MGVAVGFDPAVAPATLPWEPFRAAHGKDAQDRLRNLCLFFGKRDSLSRPEILALARPGGKAPESGQQIFRSVTNVAERWHLNERAWQRIVVDGVPIRFRIINRTGAAPFAARAAAAVWPRLAVFGIIMPGVPSGWMSWLFRAFNLFDLPRRWWVDFDLDGCLRHSELAERAASAVAESGDRFAIYLHDQRDWRRRTEGIERTVDVALSGGRSLTLEEFSPSEIAPDDKALRDALSRLYSSWGSRVLRYSRQDEMLGAIHLPGKNIRITDQPLDRVPDPSALGQSGVERDLSFDWLNRACRVEGLNAMGLAKHWFATHALAVSIERDHLEVVVLDRERQGPVQYRIGAGEYGALGPLWVRYEAEGASK